ncbi:anti-sigma factor family protein, partial [Corallococcus sicarius]
MTTADCPNLSAFVDGGLPPEDQDGFRAHLASCEVCWVRLHELLQVDVLGRMAFAEEAEVREAASAPWPQP